MSPADRAGAVADAFSLASAGQLGMDVALNLASTVKNDPDNLVRQTVVSRLSDLLLLFSEVRVEVGTAPSWRDKAEVPVEIGRFSWKLS